jgi:hypothetical protein
MKGMTVVLKLWLAAEPDTRERAADLHGAGKPRQNVSAQIVDSAGPGGLVERLDLAEVETTCAA